MTVRNSVVQQYLAVLEAQAQVELQEQQVTRNEENLRLAQARFEVGQATMLDVRQAEVARGQSEVALLRANQTVTVEKLRLFQQMGVPAPEDPSVVLLSDSFPIVAPDFELGMLINAAMMDNPDVISFRAQTRSMERNERSVKSQWLPSASFSASWSGFTQQFTNSDFLVDRAAAQSAGAFASCQETNTIRASAGLTANDCTGFSFTPDAEASIRAQNSVFPFDFSQQPFAARVSISLPIFDQFSRNLQISQAAAQADDAREQTRARELQVRTDVSNLHFGLIAAYRAIQIQENNQESAQEQLRLARERYRVGSGTFFELLDAQVVGQQAAADYITAIYSYHRALADLEAAVGSPLR